MKINKVKIIFRIIYVIYAVVLIYLILQSDFLNIVVGILSLIGIAFLVWMNKKYNRLFNDSITCILIVFIMVALLFGTCLNFYDINHYDDFLHIWSGFIGCSVAYLIFDCFAESKIDTKKKTVFFLIYMFMFSMGVASVWELIEFGMDKYLGFNCQAGGLGDTMIDIFDGFIGSFIMTWYYYFKIKNDD